MWYYNANMNLSLEEVKAVMEIRHANRKDKYIMVGDVKVFGFNDEVMEQINKELEVLYTTCVMLDFKIAFDIEIKSQKRIATFVALDNNKRLDLSFILDKNDRVRNLISDISYHKKELDLKKNKISPKNVTQFFNKVKGTLGIMN